MDSTCEESAKASQAHRKRLGIWIYGLHLCVFYVSTNDFTESDFEIRI